MFIAYRMMHDVDDVSIELFSEEAATAINRLNGEDMSWDRYDAVVDAIIALDERYQRARESVPSY